MSDRSPFSLDGPPEGEDDPTAARLRAALTAEAAMVHPQDTLSTVRERTAAPARPWWRHPATLATAAAVVLGLAVGGAAAVLGGDDDPTSAVPGDRTTSAPPPGTTSAPAPTPSATGSTGTPTAAGPSSDVWVYYVKEDDQGPRLVREQHQEESAGNTPNPGLLSMLGDSPADPDYTSPWPSGTRVLDYAVDGDTATVDLSGFVSLGAAYEDIAVQQLVYTVTANDPSVKQVRLRVNGEVPTSGHQDWSRPVARAPRLDVQATIWLLSPTEGSTSSSQVTVDVYGTAFEGTVTWEVRPGGDGVLSDEVLAEGTIQVGANGEFGEGAATVDLEPGVYVVSAFEASAEDGRPLHTDTKTFTVR